MTDTAVAKRWSKNYKRLLKAFSVEFPVGSPEHPPAARRRPLQSQHLGLAAVTSGYCCYEDTHLYLNVEWNHDRHVVVGVLENATGQSLFFIREKALSLHRQRTILDANQVPVATMRMGVFQRRKATYSIYPREEFSKTATLFKFSMVCGKLEMTFNDLMTGETCRLGCEGERGDVEIWLQRGVSNDNSRQPIAHMYPGRPGTPLGYVVDIAEGVDAVMVILLCVGVHDSEPGRKWKAPLAFNY
ncbi:hypothetical protein PHYBOEH_007836 [Phytophthora boehmeriae]|uniref:Uncharacterized protein n=1 Tax=Phytophthora boehmeriae TaxID=109152 RepID=A0A8T1X132_9STRA|nr:hypothetical protein PHYBOEH_007836 [Phytophthora boehmeriae]